mmetsp:Transcript_10506/g.23640  ORF Transcript_10506/g.23640 Transcript_10506/m.23640 type:complete len:365 (-) Transcript_10506:78-1172(-)
MRPLQRSASPRARRRRARCKLRHFGRALLYCGAVVAPLGCLASADPLEGTLPFNFETCTEHLRRLDWNENITDEVWEVRYGFSVSCLKHSQRLAQDAGDSRPAALTGVHVPTIVVPAASPDFPQLPAFYYVLPVWDMVVSNRMRLVGYYDQQELDLLLRVTSPGDTFVDIGANMGAITVPLAAHVGKTGSVYAFEPFRQVFQYLNANVAANGLMNVYTFQHALSDDSAAPRIRTPAPSLSAGQNAGMYSVFQGESLAPNEQTSAIRERMEDVSVRTLDSFGLSRVDVVKIDVEGHAARVLAGSLETLRAHRPILWFEEGGDWPPETVLRPELRYWCTRLSETQEQQFLCVPRERHAEIQAKLNA